MREDLGALFARITRRLIELERPILDAHGLTMWGYVALNHVALSPPSTQLALAAAIGHDKTRLIGVLDGLERDGLITRSADPSDRRAKLVRITSVGVERHTAVVADIRTMEDELLASLPAGEREALLAALRRLAA
ncbi:MarR family winged helix-turn-helix transcriptional regulator [Solirubrobacter soli]|uniref:MarR family winged helix-turn-helix transcriptional regulator n=1 Tax=Solirubrobacter soli TaxID=363832 RepID=UPI00041E71F2|nr:MarR family transcriptional regulator [Solirubrobacter soli]